MSLYRKVLIPTIAGLIVAGAAQAQLLPTWESHITLTQQDMEMIHNAVSNQVHGKPVGTTASWSNPASGNSGSVKLLKKLPRASQQCEEIGYAVRSGGIPVYTEHYHLPAVCNRRGPGRLRELGCSEALPWTRHC